MGARINLFASQKFTPVQGGLITAVQVFSCLLTGNQCVVKCRGVGCACVFWGERSWVLSVA